jgi:hypothetical protein
MAWQAGQSGNPGGRPKEKPFRDALRMEEKELANEVRIQHPPGSLRWHAQNLLLNGEMSATREIADRFDGKPAQAVVGDDDADPISVRTIVTGVPRKVDGDQD